MFEECILETAVTKTKGVMHGGYQKDNTPLPPPCDVCDGGVCPNGAGQLL